MEPRGCDLSLITGRDDRATPHRKPTYTVDECDACRLEVSVELLAERGP